jgi:hypothetical protein
VRHGCPNSSVQLEENSSRVQHHDLSLSRRSAPSGSNSDELRFKASNFSCQDRRIITQAVIPSLRSHGRAKLLLSRRPLTSKRGSPGGSPYRSPAPRSYHTVTSTTRAPIQSSIIKRQRDARDCAPRRPLTIPTTAALAGVCATCPHYGRSALKPIAAYWK